MRISLVPPYRGSGYAFSPESETYYLDAIEDMRRTGLLDGVEVSIDQGAHTDHVSATRDENYFDHSAVATFPG